MIFRCESLKSFSIGKLRILDTLVFVKGCCISAAPWRPSIHVLIPATHLQRQILYIDVEMRLQTNHSCWVPALYTNRQASTLQALRIETYSALPHSCSCPRSRWLYLPLSLFLSASMLCWYVSEPLWSLFIHSMHLAFLLSALDCYVCSSLCDSPLRSRFLLRSGRLLLTSSVACFSVCCALTLGLERDRMRTDDNHNQKQMHCTCARVVVETRKSMLIM